MEESSRMTEDRDKWRKYVHGVANPRIETRVRHKEQNRTGEIQRRCDEAKRRRRRLRQIFRDLPIRRDNACQGYSFVVPLIDSH